MQKNKTPSPTKHITYFSALSSKPFFRRYIPKTAITDITDDKTAETFIRRIINPIHKRNERNPFNPRSDEHTNAAVVMIQKPTTFEKNSLHPEKISYF